jgi:hypothetical protein
MDALAAATASLEDAQVRCHGIDIATYYWAGQRGPQAALLRLQ